MSTNRYIIVHNIWTCRGANMDKMLPLNIRTLRLQNGLSQTDLASKLNVTKQCVSNWENDNVQPLIEMLVKIADTFNISTDTLLGRKPDNVIDVSGLSTTQISHIRLLIADLAKLNKI